MAYGWLDSFYFIRDMLLTFFLFLLGVAEGTSIYVRHLPGNATIEMLEAEFKKFGAIGNGGIQVVNQRVRSTD